MPIRYVAPCYSGHLPPFARPLAGAVMPAKRYPGSIQQCEIWDVMSSCSELPQQQLTGGDGETAHSTG
ncbi:UNVERIFIED_CONTAM: hypothetical protein K2H54_072525 [Gekko kuhli]